MELLSNYHSTFFTIFQFKPLHILAIGKDTEILSRLFRLGQTCAEKSSVYTTGVSLTGRVIQDKYQSARYFVEGQGPVVQSIVSLTSSLRGQLIKCFTNL